MAKLPTTESKEEKPKNYFKAKELKCKATGEEGIDPDFLELLNKIRHECGFSFPLSSAYRSPQHPIEARKNTLGSHTHGKAVDVICSGAKALEVIRVAQKHGVKRIGIQQKGQSRFIHLDVCTVEDGFSSPAMWSY